MEITTKPFFFFFFCFLFFVFSFFLHTWLYLLMTPALIMLVPSYNGVEVYYLKGVVGLPIVISFRDRWYIHIFFFWKWAHWWRHRHRLDRFRFENFPSPALWYQKKSQHDKTNKITCMPSKDSDEPVCCLLTAWRNFQSLATYYVQNELYKICRKAGIPKYLVGAHSFCFVLSCCGSNNFHTVKSIMIPLTVILYSSFRLSI